MELHQFAIAAGNSSKRLRQLWPLAIVILSSPTETAAHRQAAEAVSGVSAHGEHGEHGLSHHWNDPSSGYARVNLMIFG